MQREQVRVALEPRTNSRPSSMRCSPPLRSTVISTRTRPLTPPPPPERLLRAARHPARPRRAERPRLARAPPAIPLVGKTRRCGQRCARRGSKWQRRCEDARRLTRACVSRPCTRTCSRRGPRRSASSSRPRVVAHNAAHDDGERTARAEDDVGLVRHSERSARRAARSSGDASS